MAVSASHRAAIIAAALLATSMQTADALAMAHKTSQLPMAFARTTADVGYSSRLRDADCIGRCTVAKGSPLRVHTASARPSSRSITRAGIILMVDDDAPKIRWFPLVDITSDDVEPKGGEGCSVMPLFPLGATYLPCTSPVLNIFEPRYRQMYNDILMNGARRFCVTNVDGETGQLAEVGVVFYLDDLKEVSGQTQDRVKYVGQHRVIGRVQLQQVLNPKAAKTRDTYLKAEVRDVVDVDEGDTSKQEEELNDLFLEVVNTQQSLNEEPRFTDAVKGRLSFGKGSGEDDKGLWGTILLWQQFLEQRTAVVGQRMQREIQAKVTAFLKDNKLNEGLVNARGEVRLEDLPPPLLQEIVAIQGRFKEELDAFDTHPMGDSFQEMLQSDSHLERLALFKKTLEKERKRLSARATLQSLFKK